MTEFEAFRRAFDAPDVPEGALRASGSPDKSEMYLRELYAALTPRMPPGIIPPEHATDHPPQQAFLLLDDEEAFYGGAAGGGKTEALLKAAVQYVDIPHYRALVLRRTYPELAMPGAIMDRAKQWFAGTGVAKWSADEHMLTFPSGSTVTFAHAQHPDDVLRFGGTEFHFVAFDELTRFTEGAYTFLFSRLRRTTGDPIPIRMRSASNPGDIGHDWVKRRFVKPGDPSRTFIPAKLTDNPSLDVEAYMRGLMKLHPTVRARLIAGDWDIADAGAFFQRLWFPILNVPPASLRRVVRYWDLASTAPDGRNDPDYTVGAKMGLDWESVYWCLSQQRMRSTAGERDLLIKQTAILDGKKVPVYFEQEPGSAGKAQIAYFKKMLPGWAVYGVRSDKDKQTRAAPLASQAQVGNVRIVEGPWVEEMLMEFDAFGTPGIHDDQVDAWAGAFEQLALTAATKVVSW